MHSAGVDWVWICPRLKAENDESFLLLSITTGRDTRAALHIQTAEGLLLEDAALLIGYRQELPPRTEEAAVYGKIKSLQEDCKQDIDLLPGRIERWDTFIQCSRRECWSQCSNTPCIDNSHLEEYMCKVDYK